MDVVDAIQASLLALWSCSGLLIEASGGDKEERER